MPLAAMRTLTNDNTTVPLLRARQLVISSLPLHIDLSIQAGDRIALTGDASGVTALLRSLSRVDEPEDGQLWWGKKNVTHLKPRRLSRLKSKVGYIPANPYTLFDYHSPVVRLFSHAEQKRFPLEDMAKAVGLSPVIVQQQVKALSGATLVRVALMRMALIQPDILLVDDVFSHLAPEARQGLLTTIEKLLTPQQALLVSVQHPALHAHLQSCANLVDGHLVYR